MFQSRACSAIKLLHHVLPMFVLEPYESSSGPIRSEAYMLCEMLCISNRFFRAQNNAAHSLSPRPLGSRSGRLWAIKSKVTKVSEYSSSALCKLCKGCLYVVGVPVRPWDIACKPPLHPTFPCLSRQSGGTFLAPRRSPNALFGGRFLSPHKNIVARYLKGGRKVRWVICSQVQPPDLSKHGSGAAPLRKEKGVTNRGRT